jgi:hypothetical protein
MRTKRPKEIHFRVTPGCFKKLEVLSQDDELPIAAVCRQAVWQYIRLRLPEASAKTPPDTPA